MRITACLLMTALCTLPAHHLFARTQPEVLSPQDGQRIGEPGDPNCKNGQPCARIRAEGWVPAGRTPFFVVAPVKAAPRKWIQPIIGRVNPDRTFSGLVYLGESHNGAGEWFKIHVVACESPDRFTEGDEFTDSPADCEMSDPVEVYRER